MHPFPRAAPHEIAGGGTIRDPLVGIGLPTHNGERYIREALDALRAQEYANLRIYISDNASTDGTAEICRAAAAEDERIVYRRLEHNVGAVGNFNEVFELAEGPYFMWAADDDRWHPAYVRRCVAALEGDDRAVMVTTGLRFIDEAGDLIDWDYTLYDNPDLSSGYVVERAAALVRRAGWYGVYGLARRDALARTRGFRNVYGPDVVLTLEIALQGPILKIPEVLFWYRRFAERTEEARAKRQGMREGDHALRAKYTSLQESLTGAVLASTLGRRTKALVAADILRAVYFEDTPFRRYAAGEVGVRARSAAADRDFPAFAKFASLAGYRRAQRVARRTRRRVMRRVRARRR